MNEVPAPSLRHLTRLTDDIGIVEHALLRRPRHERGYCTDDAGRLLAVASTFGDLPGARGLASVALRFLAGALTDDGAFRLRRGSDGSWTGDLPSDDASGRAVLGLGTAAARAPWRDVRRGALAIFDDAVRFRSRHPRALAYAALGAVEVLGRIVDHGDARRLVAWADGELPGAASDPAWPWPEKRLSYANGLIPEARLAVALVCGDSPGTRDALALLSWLVEEERSGEGWYSFAPTGGRGASEAGPAFDQQPIEAWAMADACARAFAHTGDWSWAEAVQRAGAWFAGYNDVGVAMYDPLTGGGFDGLEATGVNLNEGAESTLAFAAASARARRLTRAATGGAA